MVRTLLLLMFFSLPVSAVELQLELRIKETENGTIFHGETNLPDGTKLGINLEKDGDIAAQDFAIYVKDSVFSSPPFTKRGTPLSGEYKISVFTYFNKIWQRNDVLEKLKNYTGPSIKNGKLEDVSKITLGSNLSDQSRNRIKQLKQQEIEENKKTQEIWQTAHELLRQGKDMENLRNSAGMRQCMQSMRRLQPKVKELQAQVDSLPNGPNNFRLGVATTVLDLCVSCSENLAMKNCAEAEDYLGQIKP